MAMQPHSQSNHGFPFYINGVSGGPTELQQQIQQQPQYQQHQAQQWQGHVVANPNPHVASTVSNTPNLVALFEIQLQELDQLCNTQNEQTKFMLHHHMEVLFQNIENYSLQVLAKKDHEIVQAVKHQQVLEAAIRSLEAERKELERVADERKTLAIALHSKLQEENNRRMMVPNDVESCCGENEEVRSAKKLVFCPKCNTNPPVVLFLPCRHLSSCKECIVLLQSCPICGMEKKNAIEIRSLTCE